MGRLDGKVALITGGARGQGAAEGKLFRAEGAEVYLTDVLVDEGIETAAEIGATFIEHDVTDSDAWTAIVKRIENEHAHLDVLINNAGIFHMMGMADTERELWDRTIAINQTGVFLGLQAVAAIMTSQKSGSIINISSIAGLRGSGGAFAYGASKWAVRGMTKSAAQELSPHGIRVNSIHPGIIETAMVDEFSRKGINENVRQQIPMGHYADASEVANLALFLACDESTYCSGSEFVVDGGMTA
ncbi:MAG: glucose 1-dehydrogenase [Pseudomonadales bacterium]|nr:glucose 1-dehydrogenase [Pseudomonadales bacterium]MDG1443116.1 glucose 1-dehydrogenase [Pseudomonadales bacterium]